MLVKQLYGAEVQSENWFCFAYLFMKARDWGTMIVFFLPTATGFSAKYVRVQIFNVGGHLHIPSSVV
jgi:hypothetical protein